MTIGIEAILEVSYHKNLRDSKKHIKMNERENRERGVRLGEIVFILTSYLGPFVSSGQTVFTRSVSFPLTIQ